MSCSVKHPEHPELGCVLPRSERSHPEHLAMRYVTGRSQPEQLVWTNPDYRSPLQMKEQSQEAVRTVLRSAEVVSREIIRQRPQSPLGAARGQRKPTRLGQVANLLVNNVGVWIDGHRLETQQIGGSSGLRRLRELRDDYGWAIEQRPVPGGTDQYRLIEMPDEFKDAHAQ